MESIDVLVRMQREESTKPKAKIIHTVPRHASKHQGQQHGISFTGLQSIYTCDFLSILLLSSHVTYSLNKRYKCTCTKMADALLDHLPVKPLQPVKMSREMETRSRTYENASEITNEYKTMVSRLIRCKSFGCTLKNDAFKWVQSYYHFMKKFQNLIICRPSFSTFYIFCPSTKSKLPVYLTEIYC